MTLHVLWCGQDKVANLSDDSVLLCATCNTMMEVIGWIEECE
jgi:hypothetical protein